MKQNKNKDKDRYKYKKKEKNKGWGNKKLREQREEFRVKDRSEFD